MYSNPSVSQFTGANISNTYTIGDSMRKFINRRIYTDVESFLITDIDEVRGTATAIQVEKRITARCIPGGFAGHCPNLDKEFADAEPIPCADAKPFRITRNKDGIWGFRHAVIALSLPLNGLDPQWVEDHRDSPGVEIVDDYLFIYETTKSGKRKTTFEKLGTLSDYCGYFYDYNF